VGESDGIGVGVIVIVGATVAAFEVGVWVGNFEGVDEGNGVGVDEGNGVGTKEIFETIVVFFTSWNKK
jgi:hypothetical protein